jgi:(E)-4-hydroxy-3-methylbut-2-enyl-diphosphate synthase
VIKVDNIKIGDGAPVTVQSMTNTPTEDAGRTIEQISALADAGCDIIRVALPGAKAVQALPEILQKSKIPVIGDIHFDYRLALEAIKSGIHGIRINPGNIGGPEKVRKVAEAAGEAGISIRVGSNSGSLPADILKKYEGTNRPVHEVKADALIEAAVQQCKILEEFGFSDIKVSLKSSDVITMIHANRKFASEYSYPLHLGVTEAGTLMRGTIKSSIGIGTLLQEGIGDTIRVSLTADPLHEIKAGIMILESLGLRKAKPEIISCPTCGRTEIDLMGLAERVELEVEKLKASGVEIKVAKIAVMGCIVNGPGEAKDADLGIAGSKRGKVSLFKKGVSIGIFPQEEAFTKLIEELKKS